MNMLGSNIFATSFGRRSLLLLVINSFRQFVSDVQQQFDEGNVFGDLFSCSRLFTFMNKRVGVFSQVVRPFGKRLGDDGVSSQIIDLLFQVVFRGCAKLSHDDIKNSPALGQNERWTGVFIKQPTRFVEIFSYRLRPRWIRREWLNGRIGQQHSDLIGKVIDAVLRISLTQQGGRSRITHKQHKHNWICAVRAPGQAHRLLSDLRMRLLYAPTVSVFCLTLPKWWLKPRQIIVHHFRHLGNNKICLFPAMRATVRNLENRHEQPA